jgi:hypothetical protein
MAAGWSIARSTYDTSEDAKSGILAGNRSRKSPADAQPPPWSHGRPDPTPEEQHLASNAPRGAPEDTAAPIQQRSTSAAANAARSGSYRPTAYATVFAGMAVNAAVLLGALFVIARPPGWAMQALWGEVMTTDDIDKLVARHHLGVPGPAFLSIGVFFLMLWVLAGQVSRHAEERTSRGTMQRAVLSGFKWLAYACLGLGVVLTVALWLLPKLSGVTGDIDLTGTTLASVGSALGVVGAVVRILRKPATRFAPVVGGLTFGGLLIFLASVWTAHAATSPIEWSWTTPSSLTWWALVATAIVLLQISISPERWSLASFYRSKLRLAYATYRPQGQARSLKVYRNDGATSKADEREPYLHAFTARSSSTADLAQRRQATPLVVCATATASSRAVRTHHDIPAVSVTFDPDNVVLHVPDDRPGRWVEYSAPTAMLNWLGHRQGKRITTMLAVAVSSAAVSPAMGRFKVGPTSMLLAFANIRLGVWLPNPRYAMHLPIENKDDNTECKPGYPRTGLGYLLKEFFGLHDLADPFLYITDGGHWENTGLVEMLRRTDILEVVCIDADAGPADAVSSLGKALDLAPLECNVQVWINLDPLRARASGGRAPSYAPRTVNVGFFTRVGDERVGVLWYAKPGLAQLMPQNLLAFRETHADFPHVSTLDQFFDTSSFIAYRGMGRYNAREILIARRTLQQLVGALRGKTPDKVSEHLNTELAEDDCHWVVQELRDALRWRSPDEWDTFCVSVAGALADAPDRPAKPEVQAGDCSVTVTWTPPADNGAPITGYRVKSNPDGAWLDVSKGVTELVLNGLENGTQYRMEVVATNSIGESAASESSDPATPSSATASAGATSTSD